MSKKKNKFLLKSERAQLLADIEQGKFAKPEGRMVSAPAFKTIEDSQAVAIIERASTTETTAQELKNIGMTVAGILVILGALTVAQQKSPMINQFSQKIGEYLNL
ncbi:hypothetical protein HY065_00780 [Candidatus Berkelbacteria bacterium]|nr:hypothetical protein [Candidatus Berkelbacteria bacterium]